MVTIQSVLKRISGDYRRLLAPGAILHICRQVGYTFRQRVLGPVETIYWFLVQVLHGNTACSHVRYLMGQNVSDSAYCQARSRLSVQVIRRLLRWVVSRLREASNEVGRWRGHRVFHIDGSSFSMPDTPPLQSHFGQSGEQRSGCGFPTAHLLALFDAGTGFVIDVLAGPLRSHDLSKAAWLHPHLRAGDVLVGDRAFGTYAHMALLMERGLHALLRIQQAMIVDFTPGRAHNDPQHGRPVKGRPRSRWLRFLGVDDQLVAWLKPHTIPRWMPRADYARLPDQIEVRELRYGVCRRGFRPQEILLATTLTDTAAYPADVLADLYRCRWQVEVNLRHLKQTMRMDVLRCKTVDGVTKELLMFALAYNLVRCVMLESAHQQEAEPDWISFVDALRWLASGGNAIPLAAIRLVRLRPDRLEPRVVKRRPKPFKRMTKPRAELRKELERQYVSA